MKFSALMRKGKSDLYKPNNHYPDVHYFALTNKLTSNIYGFVKHHLEVFASLVAYNSCVSKCLIM